MNGDIGAYIHARLVQINTDLSGLHRINDRIGWVFTEMLGTLVANRSRAYAGENLINAIEKIASQSFQGQSVTSRGGGVQFGLEIDSLDQDFLKALYEQQDTYVKRVDKDTFTLKATGGSTQGKTDASFSFMSPEGVRKTAQLSIKNYSLKGSNSVTLQSSGSLLAYLEGARDMGSGSEKFVEYILNIYADHPKEEIKEEKHFSMQSDMDALRESAKNTLKAQMLYSALTGRGQMKTGREAEILVVYDKSAQGQLPRVRIYDMFSIVRDIIDNKNFSQIQTHPSFNKTLFANTWEGEAEGKNPSEAGMRLRYTKILHQARSQNVSVSLMKALLRR